MYKILIIEDDLTMAQAIQKEMKMWGNDAQYVQDFKNVLETFAEFDPHLVLMDITLPFYNGYHWCSEIRKISNVPVIFISSAAFIFHQCLKNTKFIFRKIDLLPIISKRRVIQVQYCSLMLKNRYFSGQVVCSAKYRLDLRRQHTEIERLRNKIISSHIHSHDNVHIISRRRNKNYRFLSIREQY